jgi:hypothetical protein
VVPASVVRAFDRQRKGLIRMTIAMGFPVADDHTAITGSRSVAGPRRPAARRSAPAPAPRSSGVREALADAHRCLDRAMASSDLADRYAAAHLGALRGAAAVLATLPRPVSRTVRNASAWVQLERLAPEYASWAAFFAAGSAKRKAAEAGMTRLISREETDDLIRQTGLFLELIDRSLLLAA